MKKLIAISLFSILFLTGMAWGEERPWKTDPNFMTFDGIQYRSCAVKVIKEYPDVYLCYERTEYHELFGVEFGFCRDRRLGDIGDFWEKYKECVKELNRKGIYDIYDTEERKSEKRRKLQNEKIIIDDDSD